MSQTETDTKSKAERIELPKPVVEPIKLVFFVVNRGEGRAIDEICTEDGIYGHLLLRGRGTVDNKTASLLGLDERERDIVLVTVASSKRDAIIAKVTERLRLDKPGRGIAMSIPFSSIASQFNSYLALAGLFPEKPDAPKAES